MYPQCNLGKIILQCSSLQKNDSLLAFTEQGEKLLKATCAHTYLPSSLYVIYAYIKIINKRHRPVQ